MNEQSRLASIGQLAAGVAHEINNPLATVLLTCDYIIRTGAGEGIADELDSITKSTQRAARIVQNLLTFARGDTPEFKPMSMESVVAMALELKKSDFTTNNISVSPSADEDVPATSIDPNQMLQVMLNLLNNSQHSLARSRTGGNISTRVSLEGNRVVTTVHDDGPGIAQDIRGKVFDPFFTTKDPG